MEHTSDWIRGKMFSNHSNRFHHLFWHWDITLKCENSYPVSPLETAYVLLYIFRWCTPWESGNASSTPVGNKLNCFKSQTGKTTCNYVHTSLWEQLLCSWKQRDSRHLARWIITGQSYQVQSSCTEIRSIMLCRLRRHNFREHHLKSTALYWWACFVQVHSLQPLL